MRRVGGRYSLFLQFLLSLCFLLVLIVLCLSFALSTAYEHNAQRLLESSSRQILTQVAHSLERFDASARTFAVALLATNPVIQLMHNSTLEPWDAVRTLDTIKVQLSSDSFIHSVYVYNSSRDCFYTTIGNGIQTRVSFFDAEVVPLVSATEAKRLVPIPRRMPNPALSVQGEFVSVYTYVLSEHLVASGTPVSCVIVNVNADYVMEIIQSEAQGRIVVLDAQGKAVGRGRDEAFLADLSLDEPYARVLSAPEPSGCFTHVAGRERDLVTYVTLPRMDWRLVRTEPYRSVIRPIVTQRIIIALITAVFLCCGLGLAVLFSRRLYSPIRDLVRDVRHALDSSRAFEQTRNELSFLSQAFAQTVDRVNLLRHFRDSNLRLLREEFLRTLIEDRAPPPEQIEAKLKELEIPFHLQAHYACALFRIDHEGQPQELSASGRLIYGLAVSDTLRAVVGLQFPCEIVEREPAELVLVVEWSRSEAASPGSDCRSNERARMEGQLLPAIAAAQERLQSSFGVCLSAAVSWPEQGFGSVAAMCRQAERILCYRLLRGPGCLLGPWEARAPSPEGIRFPVEHEGVLLACLREADLKGARREYGEIVRLLVTQPYESIMLSLTRLASSIFDLLGTVEANSDLEFPVRFSSFMHELGLCETMDRVGELFGELFEAVCVTQRSLVSEKCRRNVQLVKEVVAARYREPGLCVAAIADSMRMSPVYLGKIFRDACHCSVAEHITAVRLERTRELLEGTSSTVKEIAREVGIDRARFLFAKFRERYGATPTAYRLRHLRKLRGDGAGARPA